MLPKTMYETIPHACFAAALVVALANSSNTTLAFALMLYLAGAAIWIQRSTYRRRDRIISCQKGRGGYRPSYSATEHFVPAALYEWLPFLYIGLGVLVTRVGEMLGYPFAILLVVAGGMVLRMRWLNRNCRA